MPAPVPFALDPDLLAGKVAVVTGASRGLGAGLAARFAEHGLQLGLCARTEPSAPPRARCLTGAVDVTDPTAVDRFATAVASNLGPIDLWVNNAGVHLPLGPQRKHDPKELYTALAVNIGGVALGTQAFTSRARGWTPGRRVLINISSGASTAIYEGWSVYSATKAAVDHFTEVVAAEEPEVLCYAVAPGRIDTDLQRDLRNQDDRAFPDVHRFRLAASTGAWNSPAWVADHLLGILAGSLAPERVVYGIPEEPRD